MRKSLISLYCDAPLIAVYHESPNRGKRGFGHFHRTVALASRGESLGCVDATALRHNGRTSTRLRQRALNTFVTGKKSGHSFSVVRLTIPSPLCDKTPRFREKRTYL